MLTHITHAGPRQPSRCRFGPTHRDPETTPGCGELRSGTETLIQGHFGREELVALSPDRVTTANPALTAAHRERRKTSTARPWAAVTSLSSLVQSASQW